LTVKLTPSFLSGESDVTGGKDLMIAAGHRSRTPFSAQVMMVVQIIRLSPLLGIYSYCRKGGGATFSAAAMSPDGIFPRFDDFRSNYLVSFLSKRASKETNLSRTLPMLLLNELNPANRKAAYLAGHLAPKLPSRHAVAKLFRFALRCEVVQSESRYTRAAICRT
jgi:hypothetical protein